VTDYRLWGAVSQIGPQEFAVTVCLLSEPPGITAIDYKLAESREAALYEQATMTIRLIARTLSDGDQIIEPECAK
jgi:hypothetical protein